MDEIDEVFEPIEPTGRVCIVCGHDECPACGDVCDVVVDYDNCELCSCYDSPFGRCTYAKEKSDA